MDDKKIAPQAAVSNQASAEVQQAQYEQSHYSGGNAMLDAQIQAGEMEQGNEPFVDEEPNDLT